MNRALATVVVGVWAFGCYSGPSGPQVQRVTAEKEILVGDQWNDEDSRLVSKEMVTDLLSRAWLDDWRREKGSKPRIVVGRVANKSHDHIPVDTFIKDLERELINSGEVNFVASFEQRGQLKSEKLYQAEAASLETQKAMGRELGADFLLVGQINSIVQRGGNLVVKYYQTELELINIETGVKVWIGQKKIKKLIKRPEWDL